MRVAITERSTWVGSGTINERTSPETKKDHRTSATAAAARHHGGQELKEIAEAIDSGGVFGTGVE